MVGILLPGQDRSVALELLPLDKQKRVIDSQLTAMRFAGIQDIYLFPLAQHVQEYTNVFSGNAYRMMGIHPRVILTDIEDATERFLFALEEVGKGKDVLISESTYIVPPDCYYDLIAAKTDIQVGVRALNTGEAVFFTEEAVDYVIQNRINPSIAGERAARIYDVYYTYPVDVVKVMSVGDYLKVVKGNNDSIKYSDT